MIVSLALFLGAAGAITNIHFETEKRDQNLQNIAKAVAGSPILTDITDKENATAILSQYLDSLKDALDDIDVISVVSKDNVRIYHSNHTLIGTVYDGTLPQFDENTSGYYTADETGPSGTQRRAYAAIYDENGNYSGFVMSIMLMKNIWGETYQILLISAVITAAAVIIEIIISAKLSGQIKKSLMGYEPDTFTAMYKIRDNILESLEEGIIAVDSKGCVQFVNEAASEMLNSGDSDKNKSIVGQNISSAGGDAVLLNTLESGEKEFNISSADADILIDSIPIKEDNAVVGAVGILHNRAEYTKLMEDLAGNRYLVDSMRANNHDFTNKLHVILGMIQMGMYDEATAYIQNISMVQRESISKIMNAVSEPSVAALLIGKIARASELNIKFVLRENCSYCPSDMKLPSEALVTVIGNLLDNAFDAMNENADYRAPKELLFGIYSRPGAVLITVDDTGCGIDKKDIDRIFENGYSTKGDGRGTGLYQVKSIVDRLGGTVTVESQKDAGTSFSVSFAKNKNSEK
ncbi:MAG: sensor histidine kinase [Candidatus Avispirillum sp.]